VVCYDKIASIDAAHKLGGSRSGILSGMKLTMDAMMIQSVAVNKFLFFNFSGHGTQVLDDNGDEEDGLDEALCPSDFEFAGSVVDDDMSRWLTVLPPHPSTVCGV